ncbi:MAG: oligoendopeptidase F [Defluviitaleaceae bacterium]|nr:oligoendopeptidase F [Defluviitaleaceae bacterium]
METIKIKKREEIPAQYKWNPQDFYATNDLWKKDIELVESEIEALKELSGTLTTGEGILACLNKYYYVFKISIRTVVYAFVKHAEDTGASEAQAMLDTAEGLEIDLHAAAAFIKPEILTHDMSAIEGFIASTPGLKLYTHYLNNILRTKDHVLSTEVEEVLANAEDATKAAGDVYNMLLSSDLKFGSIKDENGNMVEVTDGKYSSLLANPDRRVRKEAFETFWDSYAKLKNTFATLLSSSIKKDAFFAKTRKYASSLDAELADSNIPRSVYESLIETVHEFLPVHHRYWAIRKKALGVEQLHIYDKSTPLTADSDMKIPYEDAKKMVMESLAPLGQEYLDMLKVGMESGWIDVYESEGKMNGGFCTAACDGHPYVLLNHEDDFYSTLTLAHEMGHALHDYYTTQAQPVVYMGTPIFTAEVASTVNEIIMIKYFIEKADNPKTRAFLVEKAITMMNDVMFRQVMFAEFEMMTHRMEEEGETLTLEAIIEVYRGLNVKYFGPDMIIDEQLDMEWAWIEHFYESFYVYQYATGYAAAAALANRIMSGEAGALEAYLDFLKAGDSDYPIEVLKKAGVDMSSPEPVRETMKMYENLVNELEKLL